MTSLLNPKSSKAVLSLRAPLSLTVYSRYSSESNQKGIMNIPVYPEPEIVNTHVHHLSGPILKLPKKPRDGAPLVLLFVLAVIVFISWQGYREIVPKPEKVDETVTIFEEGVVCGAIALAQFGAEKINPSMEQVRERAWRIKQERLKAKGTK